MEWQELPSYQPGDPTPLDRAALWDSLEATQQTLPGHARAEVQRKKRWPPTITSRDAEQTTSVLHLNPPQRNRAFRLGSISSYRDQCSFAQRGRQFRRPRPRSGVAAACDSYRRSCIYFSLGEFYVRLSKPRSGQSLAESGCPPWRIGWFAVRFSRHYKSAPTKWCPASVSAIFFSDGDWALPADPRQWTNFVFGYDFMENHSYDCFLEMQIKNLDPGGTGKWLQFSKKYTPRQDGWDNRHGHAGPIYSTSGIVWGF